MTHTNPLLAESTLPSFASIKPEHVEPAVDAVLAEYKQQIEALTSNSSTRDFANTMLPQESLEVRLDHAWSPVSHLH